MHSLDSWQALITACHCCPSLAAVKLLRVDADDNVMGASLNLPSLVRRQPPAAAEAHAPCHVHPPILPPSPLHSSMAKGGPKRRKGCWLLSVGWRPAPGPSREHLIIRCQYISQPFVVTTWWYVLCCCLTADSPRILFRWRQSGGDR
jgi:hypothetical protein